MLVLLLVLGLAEKLGSSNEDDDEDENDLMDSSIVAGREVLAVTKPHHRL